MPVAIAHGLIKAIFKHTQIQYLKCRGRMFVGTVGGVEGGFQQRMVRTKKEKNLRDGSVMETDFLFVGNSICYFGGWVAGSLGFNKKDFAIILIIKKWKCTKIN